MDMEEDAEMLALLLKHMPACIDAADIEQLVRDIPVHAFLLSISSRWLSSLLCDMISYMISYPYYDIVYDIICDFLL